MEKIACSRVHVRKMLAECSEALGVQDDQSRAVAAENPHLFEAGEPSVDGLAGRTDTLGNATIGEAIQADMSACVSGSRLGTFQQTGSEARQNIARLTIDHVIGGFTQAGGEGADNCPGNLWMRLQKEKELAPI